MPEWDLADRLSKALRTAHMTASEMALYLGVHRNSVSAWCNGRTPISGPALRAFAARTNVDFYWLRDGSLPNDGGDGGGLPGDPQIDGGSLLLPRLDSNQEPADSFPDTSKVAA